MLLLWNICVAWLLWGSGGVIAENQGEWANRFSELSELLAVRTLLPPVNENAFREAARAWIRESDRLSDYWTREQADDWLAEEEGRIYEAGIEFESVSNVVLVTAVSSNAESAGVQVGDRILEIDKAPTAGQSADTVRSWLKSRAPRQIFLQLEDSTGGTRVVAVQVHPGRMSAVAWEEMLPTGLGYLKMNGLYSQAATEILPILQRWERDANCAGMIVDLRGAGGRSIEVSFAMASLFVPSGTSLGVIEEADGTRRELRAGEGSPLSKPVMILIDENTRGASELLVAFARATSRGAMVIGRPSRGDPMVRDLVELPWGDFVYVPVRRLLLEQGPAVLSPDGRVIPHVKVAEEAEAAFEPELSAMDLAKLSPREKEDRELRIRVSKDATLRRAVEILQALKALNVSVQR